MANRGKNAKAKAKAKKSHRKPHNKNNNNPTHTRILPKDILSNILSRLPAKTLLRLKTVSKQWRSLISSPNFISAHLHRSPSFLFFHSRSSGPTATPDFSHCEVAGSVNGILCMSKPPLGTHLCLWNPTTRLSKPIFYTGPVPGPDLRFRAAVGLGYDSRTDDYKLIRVLCLDQIVGMACTASVCSLKTGRWREVEISGLVFGLMGTKCEAVIGGMPYWVGAAEEEGFGVRPALVYFDVGREVFGFVAFPWVKNHRHADLIGCAGEFGGELGMVVRPYSSDEGEEEVVEEHVFQVWTRDDEEGWRKRFSVGPIAEFDQVLGFDEEEIVGEDDEGRVFTCRFESLEVRECSKGGSSCPGERGTIDVVRFKESLVPIDGVDRLI